MHLVVPGQHRIEHACTASTHMPQPCHDITCTDVILSPLQVPLLVLEDVARRRLRKAGIRLARPVAMGWTTAILLFTAYFFWYPPVERYTDVALRVVTSVNEGAAAAVRAVQLLLQQLGLHQAAGSAALFGSVSQAAL